jgi:cell surface protein SprA
MKGFLAKSIIVGLALVLQLFISAQTTNVAQSNSSFFIAQLFYGLYNKNVTPLKSKLIVTRLQVWVTNRTIVKEGARNAVCFTDLSEPHPWSAKLIGRENDKILPANDANNLYQKLTAIAANRMDGNVMTVLEGPGFNLKPGSDFEKVYMRKLSPDEFRFDAQLGYVTVLAQLSPNDQVAVAFQYEYNGVVYQAGEFNDQIPPDSDGLTRDIFLKLIKGPESMQGLPISNLDAKAVLR